MTSIAVVIPTKNEAQYLPRILSALAEQSYKPSHIVVADAQSTDTTRDIARAFGAHIVEGGMPGVGRNAGAKIAKSEIIIFLDADAVITDDGFLLHAHHEFVTRNLDIATADVTVERGSLVDRQSFALYNRYVRIRAGSRPHPIGTFIMVRRSVHEAIGGFDETIVFAEDQDYGKRAHAHGARFGVLNSVTIGITTRRWEKIGRLRFLLVNALAEPYMAIFGPIRNRSVWRAYDEPKS